MKTKLGSLFISLLITGIGLADTCTPDNTSTPTLDLTTEGSSGTINGAIYQQVDPQSTGTGTIDPFVRLQATGNTTKNCEDGYNTSGRPLLSGGDLGDQQDVNTDPNFTTNLLLSNIPIVNGYYQFLLDINENKGGTSEFLSLEEVQIYQSNTGSQTGTSLAGLGFLAYDMDAGGDTWVKLNYALNSGSGSGDMFLYVPVSYFDPALTYVYLYSQFGHYWGADAGFEEWATLGPSEVIPEPGAVFLLGTALAAVGLWMRRRQLA